MRRWREALEGSAAQRLGEAVVRGGRKRGRDSMRGNRAGKKRGCRVEEQQKKARQEEKKKQRAKGVAEEIERDEARWSEEEDREHLGSRIPKTGIG